MPVGDGTWSVNLVTGYLDRGDGRPIGPVGTGPLGRFASMLGKLKSAESRQKRGWRACPTTRSPSRERAENVSTDPAVNEGRAKFCGTPRRKTWNRRARLEPFAMKNPSLSRLLDTSASRRGVHCLSRRLLRGHEPPAPARLCKRRARQPVALAIGDNGKTLFVANHRSGSLSVIDTIARKVMAEYDVGRGLADLAAFPGGRYLLAIDQGASELLLIDDHDRSIRVVDRIKVSPDPVRVVVSADGSFGVSWPRSGRAG